MPRLPDETAILRFRNLLEMHDLGSSMLALVNGLLSAKGLMFKAGTAADVTQQVSAPSSTQNCSMKSNV